MLVIIFSNCNWSIKAIVRINQSLTKNQAQTDQVDKMYLITVFILWLISKRYMDSSVDGFSEDGFHLKPRIRKVFK